MVQARLLFQAVTRQNHKEELNVILRHSDMEGAVISVAFVNVAGVNLLKDELTKVAERLDVFVGIRNDITSYQALEVLLETGVKVYAVDTGSSTLTYHPKLYGVWNNNTGHVAVGSANLTFSGLTNNIETSIILDLDFVDPRDQAFLDNLKDTFAEMLEQHPDHVFRIEDIEVLKRLVEEGRLIDEACIKAPSGRPKPLQSERDALPTIGTYRIPHSPSSLATKPQPVPLEVPQPIPGMPAITIAGYDKVWESNPLIRRDLNIPIAGNTNPTGSMNWKKGRYADIDQKHYFRDVVFAELLWAHDTNIRSAHKERSEAEFVLVIKGIQYGPFTLRLSHDTNTQSTSYAQNNCMTELHWGEAVDIIAKEDLLGNILTLYKGNNATLPYIIEID